VGNKKRIGEKDIETRRTYTWWILWKTI